VASPRRTAAENSGFAKKLIPQRGWAQEWSPACSLLGSSHAAVGRNKSVEAGKQVCESQLCHFPVV
jgi:hypothetical protein